MLDRDSWETSAFYRLQENVDFVTTAAYHHSTRHDESPVEAAE